MFNNGKRFGKIVPAFNFILFFCLHHETWNLNRGVAGGHELTGENKMTTLWQWNSSEMHETHLTACISVECTHTHAGKSQLARSLSVRQDMFTCVL